MKKHNLRMVPVVDNVGRLNSLVFMQQDEALAALELVFDQLPADYREVILLSRIVGLSHEEIAEQMGRSKGAISVLLSRALARLATLI